MHFREDTYKIFSHLKTSYRPGNFAETIVVVTVSFSQNLKDGNDNSFPRDFSSNIIVPTLEDKNKY